MKRKLTIKERKFIKHYLKSGNVSQSALKAGYAQRGNIYNALSKTDLRELFLEFLEKHDLTDKKIAKVIKEGLEANKTLGYLNNKVNGVNKISDEFIDVPDHSTRHKFLTTLLELHRKLEKEPQIIDHKELNLHFGDIKVANICGEDLINTLNKRLSGKTVVNAEILE